MLLKHESNKSSATIQIELSEGKSKTYHEEYDKYKHLHYICSCTSYLKEFPLSTSPSLVREREVDNLRLCKDNIFSKIK